MSTRTAESKRRAGLGARLAGLLAAACLAAPAWGQGFASSAERVQRILQHPRYAEAVAFLAEDYPRFVAELIALTEIPAPPFLEAERAAAYLEKLRELGLEDAEMDAAGNVMGLRRGAGGPLLAVAAHLDTVFPEGTDVTVRRSGSRLSAPGIGDDASGLAALLAVARAMNAAGLRTTNDILFVGSVGEEGVGDLRGMKHLFQQGRYRDLIRGFVAVEGGRQIDITTAALGSQRYRVTFRGPGGHSYGAFGLVNPAFALGSAIARLSQVRVPEFPRTTFNVGVIGGGASVNAIPSEAWMEVDLRSEDQGRLEELADTFVQLVLEAVEEENFRRATGQGAIEVDIDLIGERPSGETRMTAPLVTRAAEVYRAFGIEPTFSRSSTDANIPISMGIPAITIDRGGLSGRAHSLDEWVDVGRDQTVRGLQILMTALLSIAGVEPE